MALMASAFPITPGKTEEWKRFIAELNGARRSDFVASRKALGVRERTFLQPTPMGDYVIVTLEGDNAAGAMAKFAAKDDEFTRWFLSKVQDLHGFDLAAVTSGPMPELVIDTAG